MGRGSSGSYLGPTDAHQGAAYSTPDLGFVRARASFCPVIAARTLRMRLGSRLILHQPRRPFG